MESARYIMLCIVLVVLAYQYIKLIRILFYSPFTSTIHKPTITLATKILNYQTKRNFIAQFIPFYLVYNFILRTKIRIYYGIKLTKMYYNKLQ